MEAKNAEDFVAEIKRKGQELRDTKDYKIDRNKVSDLKTDVIFEGKPQ